MKRKRSPARHPGTQGGKRKGAGRPALGKVLLRATVEPETLLKIRRLQVATVAGEYGQDVAPLPPKTLGEVLDDKFSA